MAVYLNIATFFAVINVFLLLILLYVWGMNYKKFKTFLVLGLIIFASVMVIQNIVSIYFFAFSMEMYFSANVTIQKAVMVLRGLELIALLFLTWVSLK